MCWSALLRSISHSRSVIPIWNSSGTVSALTSNGIEGLTALIFSCILKREIEYFLRKLNLFCVFLSITALYLFWYLTIVWSYSVLTIHVSSWKPVFCQTFRAGDLLHVGWYLFHSFVQCCKFKMQNCTCSYDQKAKRFRPLFPDIIRFLTWVISTFKHPVTTPPANFCIIENISLLILHIMCNYLEILKSQSIFLIYIIGIRNDTTLFIPAMFGTASVTSFASFYTGISRLRHSLDSCT